MADSPLGRNGSFGAFRILKQEVAGFENFLDTAAPAINLTPDQLAAKFLGRWRSGSHSPFVPRPHALFRPTA